MLNYISITGSTIGDAGDTTINGSRYPAIDGSQN